MKSAMTRRVPSRRPRRNPPLSRRPPPRSRSSERIRAHKRLGHDKGLGGKISVRIVCANENAMQGLQQEGDRLLRRPFLLRVLVAPMVPREAVDRQAETVPQAREGG